ncbi:MAG: substrate-binding domain-containing protein [Bacteroidota bacterium]|nr:substrate-binding domain-containing protein [Bacteroidota bacterium]
MTPKKFTDETPTRGNIKIAVDESYQLLADTELFTFHSLYKDAKVAPVYLSGDSILKLFLDDSVRVIITSSKLTDNEVAYLRGKSIIPRTTKIAYDALAFIVNKSNADSLIRYNTLKDIFTGKTSKWEQINPQSKLNDIKVVFDNQGSNNVKTIMNKFGITGSLPNYCFSATKNSEVINFVESHPEAIGIISVNWISDPRDSISHSFLSKINVVSVTSEYDSDGSEFYSPHPAYIANQSYPFIREVYTINRESFAGLGTGFTSFVAGDAGQRIILKMGMLPATMPIRLVEVKKN